jgi:hypothetical protein
MTSTGRYEPTENKYDLDHEINMEVERMNKILKNIEGEHSEENAKAIKKALAETIIASI